MNEVKATTRIRKLLEGATEVGGTWIPVIQREAALLAESFLFRCRADR